MRRFHGMPFIQSTSGSSSRIGSRMASARDRVARAMPTPSRQADFTVRRCQKRYAHSTVRAVVSCAMPSESTPPSLNQK